MTDHVIGNAPARGAHRPAGGRRAMGPGSRRIRVRAIAAVLGSRYAVLFWLPLAIWVTATAIARVSAMSWTRQGGINSSGSVYFLQATMGAVIIMWLGTTGFAIALGHRRWHVFLVAITSSIVMLTATHVLTELAIRAEMALGGVDGIRVLPTSDTPGDHIMPSPLFDGFLSGTAAGLFMWLPLPMAVIMALCWFQRWRWFGLLGGTAAGFVLFVGHLILFSVGVEFARGPRQYAAAQGLVFLISMTVILGLAWLAFRRRPV